MMYPEANDCATTFSIISREYSAVRISTFASVLIRICLDAWIPSS